MPAGIWREAPERFERNNMDNLSVICFANATVSLRLGHGAGLTAHRAVIQHRAAAALPYTGEASRCGGDFSPSRLRRQPPLGRGAFGRTELSAPTRCSEDRNVSPSHDSAITLSYKTGAGCSKRSRTAHFCLLGQGLPERQTAFAGWCPVLKIEYAAFVANERPGFITGHAFLFS